MPAPAAPTAATSVLAASPPPVADSSVTAVPDTTVASQSMVSPGGGAAAPPGHVVAPPTTHVGAYHDVSIVSDPLAPALNVLAHGLATWEARMMIGAVLGSFLAGRSAGIGMIDFTQPVLQACNVSIRSAFAQVRLVPCRQQSSFRASGVGGHAAAERSTAPKRDRGPGELDPVLHGALGINAEGAAPFTWTTPSGGGALLRWLAAALGWASALTAGNAAVRKHRRDRSELPYRRRLF
jgi:hypothetical protein